MDVGIQTLGSPSLASLQAYRRSGPCWDSQSHHLTRRRIYRSLRSRQRRARTTCSSLYCSTRPTACHNTYRISHWIPDRNLHEGLPQFHHAVTCPVSLLPGRLPLALSEIGLTATHPGSALSGSQPGRCRSVYSGPTEEAIHHRQTGLHDERLRFTLLLEVAASGNR